MKAICEVSRPHYHPGLDFRGKVTKKRDLSVPPNWVANERIEKNGVSYAIVMPPRDKELWEERQEIHAHIPKSYGFKDNAIVTIKHEFDIWCFTSVKVKNISDEFIPRVHFDHVDAERYGITSGEECDIIKK